MDYEKLTVAELKDLLREGGLPLSGKKAELIQRASENHAYLEILADNKKRASGAISRTVIFLASVSLLLSYAIAIDEIIVLSEISDSFYSDVISESIRIFVFLGFVSVIQYFIIPFQVDNANAIIHSRNSTFILALISIGIMVSPLISMTPTEALSHSINREHNMWGGMVYFFTIGAGITFFVVSFLLWALFLYLNDTLKKNR